MENNEKGVNTIEELKELIIEFGFSIDDLDDLEVLTSCTGTCTRSCGGG